MTIKLEDKDIFKTENKHLKTFGMREKCKR